MISFILLILQRNELHFVGNQRGTIEELFYLRFNNPINGLEILNFNKSKEKMMVESQILYNTLLMILDEELQWKIIGFAKKNTNEQIKSQDIITVVEFNQNKEYTNKIDEVIEYKYNYFIELQTQL